MSWRTLSTDEVVEEFNDRELQSLNAIKGREALGGILERVVARVRGAVYAGGTRLGEAGTIPDALASDAVAIARWRFLISVARNEGLQTKERKEAHDAAEERLRRVEAGDMAIEGPDEDATQDNQSAPAPSMTTRTLNFDKASQDGL